MEQYSSSGRTDLVSSLLTYELAMPRLLKSQERRGKVVSQISIFVDCLYLISASAAAAWTPDSAADRLMLSRVCARAELQK